jgi:hypothetical protein
MTLRLARSSSLPITALLAATFVFGTAEVAGGAASNPAAQPTAAPAAGNWHARQGVYFQRSWGIDVVGVRRVSSGYMLRLNYRVVDPDKAKPLFDKKVKPFLIDEVTGARLAVPAMENVGELRQTGSPVKDRTYFVIFGNPEKLVKSGALVSIVIGDLRVDGFTVD